MSVSSATSAPNPALLALLSQLAGPQSAAAGESGFTAPAGAASTCGGAQAASNQITGSGSATIGGEVLKLLVQMQQQLGAGASGTSTTATASTSTMVNPLSQLFSAMDSDGDGSVSESEMESYIETQGGTQNQADALYAQLDQNGSNGISRQQLADPVPASGAGGGHRHHHHHVGGGDRTASSLIQTPDIGGDDGSDTLTTASLTQAWENLQNVPTSSSSSPVMASLLDTLAKTNAGTASTTA